MIDSGLGVRQITIQEYLWVLFHVNVSMATTEGSLWKDGENTGLISSSNTKSSMTFYRVVYIEMPWISELLKKQHQGNSSVCSVALVTIFPSS